MINNNNNSVAASDSNLTRRLALRQLDNYIIDPIFPNGSIHVISGPPDIGKSTWSLQFLYQWEKGNPVFGNCKSNPCEWAYIAIDRSLRDTDRTLRRLGMGDWNIPAWSIEEIIPRNSFKQIDQEPSIFHIANDPRFKNCKLFFIEGLQGLLPNTGRGQSMNKAQMMWVIKTRDEIVNRGITIIAVNHTPKASDASHDRENMLGSQGLIGGLGTVITFNLPPTVDGKDQGMKGQRQTTNRLVTVMMKNHPTMYLTYSRANNGAFELDASQTVTPDTPISQQTEVHVTQSDNMRIFDSHLRGFEGQQELLTKQIMAWARDAGIDPAEGIAWANQRIADGKLVREGRGGYRRTSVQ